MEDIKNLKSGEFLIKEIDAKNIFKQNGIDMPDNNRSLKYMKKGVGIALSAAVKEDGSVDEISFITIDDTTKIPLYRPDNQNSFPESPP